MANNTPIGVLRGKRVTVMGLGLHGGGVSVAAWLAKHGARVLVTDLRKRKDLTLSLRQLKAQSVRPTSHGRSPGGRAKHKIKNVLSQHRREDFINADVVVRNPAVPNNSPFLQLARKHGIPIENEATLFFKHCRSKNIIGVTGTRGKSTTATMITAILRVCRRFEISNFKSRIWLAGNIRTTPMLSIVDRVKPNDWVVLELSSWHLETMDEQGLSPHIAVVTNVLPDHLNRYTSMRAYARAKETIVRHQRRNDSAVLNKENAWTRAMAKHTAARVVWFPDLKFEISALSEVEGSNPLLLGAHNVSNAAAAAAVAHVLKIPAKTIARTLRTVRRPPGRLERIRSVRGVAFYNDTTATTPDATIAALNALSREISNLKSQISNIILIAGGSDKNLSYRKLIPVIKKTCKAVVLLPGMATTKIEKQFSIQHSAFSIFQASTMRRAVTKAMSQAVRGDIILLSPAAASFACPPRSASGRRRRGLFKHEFDRGDQFVRAVHRLS